MNFELAVQIATIATLLLTAGALLFGLWSFWKQMNCQVFLAYNQRYEKIIGAFPPGALESRLKLGETLPPQSEELRICVLKYLNLCSEELFLHRHRYLAGDIWSLWKGEMEKVLRSPLLKREWQRLRGEFGAYREFFDFVESVQAGGAIQAPHSMRAVVQPDSQ